MLIQLRRVVYLLVLLQFCLNVCVVNADNTNLPEVYDKEKTSSKIKELTEEMEKEKGNTDSTLTALRTAENKYKTTVQRAQNDSNACTEFAKEIETALKNRADYETFFNENKKKKAEELVDRCTGAARDVRDAAVELNRTADDSLTAAEKLLAAAQRLSSYANEILLLQARLEDTEKEVPMEEKLKVVGVNTDASKRKTAAVRMQENATAVKEETLKAEAQARAATEAADLVEKTMEKLKSASTGKNNADKGSQTGEVDQVKDENSTENTQSDKGEPNTLKENDAVEQRKTEEAHNNTTRTIDNSQQTEAGKLERVNQQGTDKEMVKALYKSKTENTGKVREVLNTSSTTRVVESRNISTSSHSSTSMHFNVSGLSDSSRSPALVHGPLLFLTLMFVLGCTLIY